MASWQNDLMLDEAFAWVRVRATRLNVCNTIPTTYAEATSTYMLCQSSVMTSGSFTVGDGDSSGRKMTTPAISSMSVTTSGTSNYVALTGSSGSTLLLVAPCTTQSLVTGNTCNTSAWDDEIADAST